MKRASCRRIQLTRDTCRFKKREAELIQNRADQTRPNELNRIVAMWLDFAEDQAQRRKQMFMKDWELKLHKFLSFNERWVLPQAGSLSKKAADEHAREEFERFAV